VSKHEKPCRNFCLDIGGPPDSPCILCGHSRGAHYGIKFRKDRPGEGVYEVTQQTIEPYPAIETIFTQLQHDDVPFDVVAGGELVGRFSSVRELDEGEE
jgi:hypothetical protein